MNNTSLANKIALVTGGSRSLGRETALRLAEAGADVCITYRSKADEAQQTVAEMEKMGRRATALQVDLEGSAHIPAFVEQFRAVLRDWGAEKFDILVNNAGITCLKPFEAVTEADLDAQFNTNYKSVFFLTQQLLHDLRDGGRIINIGSGATRFAIPSIVGYAPLKSAIEALTQYLAKHLGARGITANVVSPGALDTDFNKDAFEGSPAMKEFIASVTALGRVGVAEDVGGVIAFVCSDAAGWITGQRLEVSGGMFL